jgi:uncharacterized protein (DUF433 family)
MAERSANKHYFDIAPRCMKVRKEIKMTDRFFYLNKSRLLISVAALVLLATALLLSQFAWADHTPDHPDRQVGDLSLVSLAASYKPNLMDSALLAAYPEVLAYQHDVMAFLSYSPWQDCSVQMNSGLTDPALLAAYPEILTYRRNVAAYLKYVAGLDCGELAARPELSSSRPSALTRPGLTDAALLAAYPEVLAYRHDVMAFLDYSARQVCSATLSPGLKDAALLAAYPEIITYRRNVEAYLQYFAQQDCSELAMR